MLRTKSLLTTATRHFSRSAVSRNREVVILSAARTPIASFQGSLSSLQAPELGAVAIKGAVERAGIDGEDVDEAYIGNVVSAGAGQAPARQAVIKAGLPHKVPCTTINKVCSSGMKSLMFAAQAVATGQNEVAIAGGFESMSNIPYYLPKARTGMGYGHGEVQDGLLKDGLWDAFDDHHMGMCAEHCAKEYGITREDQDAFALESYRRSAEASNAGRFKDEIVPVTIKGRRGEVVVDTDEEFTKVKTDKVPGLRPAFTKDGTVTAANASSLNDGAAAFVVASAEFAEKRGLKPLAKIRGFADAARLPIEFTTAPSLAIPLAMKNAGVAPEDVDFYEINEAFSVVSLANNKLLNLDANKVNVNGGAVSLGHPIGASGARIVVTLLNVLKQNDAKIGVAGICNGGGGASAIVVERCE